MMNNHQVILQHTILVKSVYFNSLKTFLDFNTHTPPPVISIRFPQAWLYGITYTCHKQTTGCS